jgi:hypothetical protein
MNLPEAGYAIPCPKPLMKVVKIIKGYTKESERKNPDPEWSFLCMFRAGNNRAMINGRFRRDE